MATSYAAIMAAKPTVQLLALLRQQDEYVPAAVAAAIAELHRREVSGFDIEAAADDYEAGRAARALAAMEPMPLHARLLWLLLPLLALTPLGTRAYRRYTTDGRHRCAMQFLEHATIGFIGYGLAFLVLRLLTN